jgi:DnaJ-domain-containing protein 1
MCLIGAILLATRMMRRLLALGHVDLRFNPKVARPGALIDVTAHVVPRGDRPITVHATLVCTMFDHRARSLFSKKLAMAVVPGRPNEYRCTLKLPEAALRTGVVGDQLSSLFSEEAHRLLVSWTVGLEVERGGVLVLRQSHALEVPEGQPLRTDKDSMTHMVVETFSSLHDDLLVNWLVQMAARDGEISPGERELLHDILRTAHGITDRAQADARIAQELEREIKMESSLVRKHIPVDKRMAFYRLLYVMAWRDGIYDPREHAFLMETLHAFGLDRSHVREVELGVLREMAKSALEQNA